MNNHLKYVFLVFIVLITKPVTCQEDVTLLTRVLDLKKYDALIVDKLFLRKNESTEVRIFLTVGFEYKLIAACMEKNGTDIELGYYNNSRQNAVYEKLFGRIASLRYSPEKPEFLTLIIKNISDKTKSEQQIVWYAVLKEKY